MTFHFSIPTPENCVSCPFKDIRVSPGYGPLKLRCGIDPTLEISAGEGLERRAERCPGKEDE